MCLVQSELSPMGDSSFLYLTPLFCQAMGLTVPELLAKRLLLGRNQAWGVIKPLISHKSIIKDDSIIIKGEQDEIITNTVDVCNRFNNYFANDTSNIGPDDSVHTDDDVSSCIDQHKNHPSIIQIRQEVYEEFTFTFINKEFIISELRKLNVRKSTGHDLLPAKLLRVGAEPLAIPIANLINMSLCTGKFPSYLKKANVCPIFKRGDNLDVANYRPVSVLPNVSKIFEKVMVSQLSQYFDPLLNPNVSGFRQGHSCESVLTKLVSDIQCALDRGMYVCIILMDLSKAFNCIPHKLLIAKFKTYGVSDSACSLLLSYFRDRQQRVKVGNVTSEWENVLKGSAQGSVNGPFSFNIFCNDMLSLVDPDVHIYNYADDNTIMYSGYNLEDIKLKLVNNINRLILWFNNNYMKVNTSKFQYMVLGCNRSKNDAVSGDTINIDGNVIKSEPCVKLLGVYLDNELSFNDHVSAICKKAGKQLNVLIRLSHVIDKQSKMLLYNTFIKSHFQFCSLVWHFCNHMNIFKMEKIQQRALQQVCLDYDSTYVDLLESTCTSPLLLQRYRKLMEFVFKVIHGDAPGYFKDIFKLKKCESLRDQNRLEVPAYNTIKYGKNSFIYECIKIWNVLDTRIKSCSNLKEFKQMISLWNGPKCNCGFCKVCKISQL